MSTGASGARAGGPDGPDAPRELLAAYALDAVDDLERRAVERLVAEDPSAAAELAGLRAAAVELGAANGSPPPAALRAALLDEIARTPQVGPAATRAPRRAGRSTARRPVLLRLAVAAAVAGAVALPATVAWQQHDRAVEAEAQAQELTELLADPAAQVLRAEVTGGGTALAVLGADSAVLVADGLAEVPGDRTYQLWAMRDGVPVPAGLLDVEDGHVQASAAGYRPGDGLAVSVEPSGGSAQPTTEPVVVLLPG